MTRSYIFSAVEVQKIKETFFGAIVWDSRLGANVGIFKTGVSWTVLGAQEGSSINIGSLAWARLGFAMRNSKGLEAMGCNFYGNDEDESAFEAGTLTCTCYGVLNNKLVFGNSCAIHGAG